MQSKYIVTCASQMGSYLTMVRQILNNDGELIRKSHKDAGLYRTKDDTVTIQIGFEEDASVDGGIKTLVYISRDLEGSIAESEERISNTRKHLSSILEDSALVLC